MVISCGRWAWDSDSSLEVIGVAGLFSLPALLPVVVASILNLISWPQDGSCSSHHHIWCEGRKKGEGKRASGR